MSILEEKANLEIGYSTATEDMPSGEMTKTDKKVVLISMENNTGKDIEISFGVEGGLVSN